MFLPIANQRTKHDVIQEFAIETREVLAQLQPALQALQEGTSDLRAIDSIRATIYAVAGVACILGLSDLEKVACRCERALKHLRAGSHPLRPSNDSIIDDIDLMWSLLMQLGSAGSVGGCDATDIECHHRLVLASA